MQAVVPIFGDARSAIVRPAFFILEDHDGASARISEYVKRACDQYYTEAIQSLKKEIAEKAAQGDSYAQTERLLISVKADAARSLIPRWTENIFIVCQNSEVTISFFPRSGGWSQLSNGSIVAYYNPAYVWTIEENTGLVRTDPRALKAIAYANFYKDMAKEGILTDFKEDAGFVAPLNK
jgi:hypothetical protein